MGNSNSVIKINYEGVQKAITNKNSYIINTLRVSNQECLIETTLSIEEEVSILNANITKNKPYIIQNLNIGEVSSILKKETHPFYLNLESDDNYSFIKIPEKNENKYLTHYMYAGQWFLFALIGIIFLVILNRKKHGKT